MNKRKAARAARVGMAASLLAACGAVTLPATPVRAQSAATQTALVQFDIPAQPLSAALTAFGDQAGLQVTVDSALLAGRAVPALSGRMTAEDALRRLLVGTGLAWRFADPTTMVLERVAADGAMTLDPVTVEGTAVAQSSPYEMARTEGSRSYAAKATTVGKEAALIKDIPRSVSVVTRQMMDDRGVTTLDEAMKQTTGMTVVKYDGGGLRNYIETRGYAIDTMQLDGVSTTWDMNTGTPFDTAIYDRIEVLRGPAGLYQSGGEPAGTINVARKRALDHWSFGAEAGIGSWQAWRGVADVTGPLIESGKLRARVVGVLDDRESFVDVVTNEKQVFYGTVEGDLNETTTLSAGVTTQRFDNIQNYGLPAYADGRMLDIDRSTYTGANWNNMEFEIFEQFAELEHRLDGGGVIKLSGRHQEQEAETLGLWANSAVNPTTGDYSVLTYGSRREAEEWSLDGHVSTPFRAGGLTHNLLLGADYRTRQSDSTGSNTPTMTGFNINAPNHNPAIPVLTWGATSRNLIEQYGTYGQARIKPGIDWLTLVAGGRMSWWNTRTKTLSTGVESGRYSTRGEFTPYGGVVWDATKEISLYASYAEIFKPQSNLDTSGAMLAPRVGGAWEVGAKGGFLDDRLTAQLALYHMVDENRAMQIDGCTGSNCYEAAGEVRSRGAEAQVSGSPRPNWDVTAGYSYVLTDHLTGTAANQGNTFSPSTPKHTTTLWLKYSFPEGSPLGGLSLGGGAKNVSDFYGVSNATRWYQNGYTVFDAMAAYAVTENLEAVLNLNNLLDEKYYEKISGAARQNYYGAPRSAMLTMRAKF